MPKAAHGLGCHPAPVSGYGVGPGLDAGSVDHQGQVDTVVLDGNLIATDQQTALPLGSDDVSVCLPASCLPELARKLVSRVFILPES